MFFSPFAQKSVIGLDIQPSGIHLIQLKRNTSDLERQVTLPVPGDVFVEGKITAWEVLGAYLKRLVIEHRIEGRAVAISMPANLARMDCIQLPDDMRDMEIEEEIRLYLQRELLRETEAVCIDFTILSQSGGYSEIFFVAIREKYVSQYISCVETAGLKVKIVDIDILAAKRGAAMLLQSAMSDVQQILQFLNEADHLIAYGLAMRKEPIW